MDKFLFVSNNMGHFLSYVFYRWSCRSDISNIFSWTFSIIYSFMVMNKLLKRLDHEQEVSWGILWVMLATFFGAWVMLICILFDAFFYIFKRNMIFYEFHHWKIPVCENVYCIYMFAKNWKRLLIDDGFYSWILRGTTFDECLELQTFNIVHLNHLKTGTFLCIWSKRENQNMKKVAKHVSYSTEQGANIFLCDKCGVRCSWKTKWQALVLSDVFVVVVVDD